MKRDENGRFCHKAAEVSITSLVTVTGGHPVTTSLKIAEVFGKEHGKVIRAIKSLECSSKFTEANFGLSEYTDSTGRKLPMYQITKDGFAMLAFGFTGKKAAQFKEAYINAFNAMEAELKSIAELKAKELSEKSRMQIAALDSHITFLEGELNRLSYASATVPDIEEIFRHCLTMDGVQVKPTLHLADSLNMHVEEFKKYASKVFLTEGQDIIRVRNMSDRFIRACHRAGLMIPGHIRHLNFYTRNGVEKILREIIRNEY